MMFRARPRPDQLLLVALVLGAAVLFWSSRTLIVPYPVQAPWYESSALFPRVMLVLIMLGGVAELLVRRRSDSAQGGSDELDSSAMHLGKAVLAAVSFMLYTVAVPWLGYAASTVAFVGVAAVLLGLSWRTALVLALALGALMWLVFVQVLQVAFGHGLLP